MKPRLTFLVMVILLAGAARAQVLPSNTLALVGGDPMLSYPEDAFTCLYGAGAGDIHLILIDPYNDNTGQAITTVGGFECSIALPAGVGVLGTTLPPGSINFLQSPEFLVGTAIPVTGPQTLLATLTISIPLDDPPGSFFTDPVLIEPVQLRYQSIPGHAAIADLNDEYSLSAAYPPSGDYTVADFWLVNDMPVGQAASPVWPGRCIVDDEEVSWGEVKALYR